MKLGRCSYHWSGSWPAAPRSPCCTPASPQSPSPSSGRSPDVSAQVWTCCSELLLEQLKNRHMDTHTHTLSLWPSGAALQSSFLFSCYLPAPGPSSCRSWAASSASSRSSPASPPALWDPAGRHRAASENGKQESGRESGSSGCCSIAHQVVIGEPRDLLLDAVLHLSLWRQRHHVAELFLLILDVTLQQLDLSVKGLQLVFVLPGLSLQLSLQQPGRTGRTRVLLTDTENNKTPKQTKKQTKTQQNTAQTDQWWYSQCVKHPLRAKTHFH